MELAVFFVSCSSAFTLGLLLGWQGGRRAVLGPFRRPGFVRIWPASNGRSPETRMLGRTRRAEGISSLSIPRGQLSEGTVTPRTQASRSSATAPGSSTSAPAGASGQPPQDADSEVGPVLKFNWADAETQQSSTTEVRADGTVWIDGKQVD